MTRRQSDGRRNLAFTDARAAALSTRGATARSAQLQVTNLLRRDLHARTAYEHIRGIYPYEITHPPLGKLILGLGIRLFGMTPFGWRFMGTLFGVLMLPILYCFLKNLFGKTAVSVCGTLLFASISCT
jgi:predicted membrane-bound mannosyltransferase